jgi:ABC-type oligopeptide transport system substrate-binding subunit
MIRRLSLSVAMLAAGTALLVTAVGAGAQGDVRKGGVFRWNLPVDVDYVDPALAYNPRSWAIPFATCANLFNYPDRAGPESTRIVPEVVDDWNLSRDGRTYTFELKTSFRFHTGAPVIARSFADAINRLAQPRLQSRGREYVRDIVGGGAVLDGRAETITGVRVLGRYRLRLRLTRPVGDFTARLTMPFFCPILPNTPVDPSGIDNPASSGPYYVAERVVNQRIVLKRNPYYRGNRPANVDEIVWTFTPPESCIAALEEDRVDGCLLPVQAAPYNRVLAAKYGINRPGGQFLFEPMLGTSFVAFNHARSAFKGPGQVPLEKAINYAIDRTELARTSGFLAFKRTDQLLPPTLARPAGLYPLNAAPSAAKRWLARAKLQPTELVLYASNNPQAVAQAQVLDFNLRQIGIDLRIRYFDPDELNRRVDIPGEPYDLYLYAWAADYADPAGVLVPLLDPDGVGGLHLEDPFLARRLDAANRLRGDARLAALRNLEVELMRESPPLASFGQVAQRMLLSRSVGCVVFHPVYFGPNLAAVCKK